MTHFTEEMTKLKETLLAMASHAESAVTRAMRALVERDDGLAQQVDDDDSILDQFEIDIDDCAIHLLAKAPLATDLRMITVAMKISQNLERVGDEAVSIARRSLELSREPPIEPAAGLPRMAAMSLDMLRDALSAFVDRRPEKARAVVPRDQEVDELNRHLYRAFSRYMIEHPSAISCCVGLMAVSKRLERIADHATNIAEEVVYLYEARDIRHSGLTTNEAKDPGR